MLVSGINIKWLWFSGNNVITSSVSPAYKIFPFPSDACSSICWPLPRRALFSCRTGRKWKHSSEKATIHITFNTRNVCHDWCHTGISLIILITNHTVWDERLTVLSWPSPPPSSPLRYLTFCNPFVLYSSVTERAAAAESEKKRNCDFAPRQGPGGSHEEDEPLWSVQQSFGVRGSHNSALGKVITCSNSHAPELNPLTTMAGKHTGLSAWSFSLPSSSPSSLSHRQSLAPASYTFYSYTIKIGKHTHREGGRVGTWLSPLRLTLLKF